MLTRVSTMLPYLLITLLCIGGVELLYSGVERFLLKPVQTERHEVVEEVVEPAINVAAPQKTVDYTIITGRNLFGPPPMEKTAGESETATVDEELEPTTLEVVLMGTIDSPEQGSRAVILNKKDRKQEIYQVGDSVEGALVKEIQRGKVILTVNDRDEMLDMSEAAQYAPNSPQAVTTPAMARRRANILSSRQINEGDGQDNVVRPRIVTPSRRVVRPRPIMPAEEPSDIEEEPVPDIQEQDIQEPAPDEQGAGDQQEFQDQGIEEQAVE